MTHRHGCLSAREHLQPACGLALRGVAPGVSVYHPPGAPQEARHRVRERVMSFGSRTSATDAPRFPCPPQARQPRYWPEPRQAVASRALRRWRRRCCLPPLAVRWCPSSSDGRAAQAPWRRALPAKVYAPALARALPACALSEGIQSPFWRHVSAHDERACVFTSSSLRCVAEALSIGRWFPFLRECLTARPAPGFGPHLTRWRCIIADRDTNGVRRKRIAAPFVVETHRIKLTRFS